VTPLKSNEDARSGALAELREQLLAAKIPFSKRASVCELPQPASDCQLLPGTTRCQLTLCEDSCTEAHRHHRTHAKPLAANAPLIFSRPSIISATSLQSSPGESPAQSMAPSMAPSTNTSPLQQYRRASHFGFGLGSHRGSMASIAHVTTGDPQQQLSGPPSPFSDGSSVQSSAANSPRQAQAPLMPEYIVPIMEESRLEAAAPATAENATAAAAEPAAAPVAASVQSAVPAQSVTAAPSGPAAPGTLPPHLAALDAQYWRLRDRIVNLRDYVPGPAGIATAEARTRMDLVAAPRDDFPDQSDASSFFDPRSPQPPSPVEANPDALGRLAAVNINDVDSTKPQLEYVYRRQ